MVPVVAHVPPSVVAIGHAAVVVSAVVYIEPIGYIAAKSASFL